MLGPNAKWDRYGWCWTYPTFEIGENASPFVIHGRSKERSDAAQTRGSMPRLLSAATVQNFCSAALFD